MKLLVKRLWFKHSIDETVEALFKLPQIRERFDEGFVYDGEIRPQGIKICEGYWPADAILDKLSRPSNSVYLLLTSLDLKGDYGRIHGKGYDGRALMSNSSFLSGIKNNIFNPFDVSFQAITFHEIGHALGLEHHASWEDSCAMPISGSGTRWYSLDEIRFCRHCSEKFLSKNQPLKSPIL